MHSLLLGIQLLAMFHHTTSSQISALLAHQGVLQLHMSPGVQKVKNCTCLQVYKSKEGNSAFESCCGRKDIYVCQNWYYFLMLR